MYSIYKFIMFFLLFCIRSFSQEISISGTVTDNQNKGIQYTSVFLLDENKDNLGYSITNENGNYLINFEKPKSKKITIEITSLGYQKRIEIISIDSNSIKDFVLMEQIEQLEEIVIESEVKIKTVQDTTTIKIASFGNKTEQTVEDILKKLPGIEILKDGTIKAHGKTIDKLLIEGEDMFDKNYKLLTKNLDANALDKVQIIDNFENNPILKKLDNSDKVALNLKLKKGKKNIWFGNVSLSSGVVSENRWKESLNLGLLKNKIKFFYFGDFNNIGDKVTDLINENSLSTDYFGEDKYEYKAKKLFNIFNNEANVFSKTQSIFNKTFLNSLSFTRKLNAKLSIRMIAYLVNDNQNQNSFSETKYNLINNPILFTENNFYFKRQTLSGIELELKYFANQKNYITNLFVFKNNSHKTNNNLFFNSDQIYQSLQAENITFNNHFYHTYDLSQNKVLNNYIYFGNDKIIENSVINSTYLNSFFKKKPNDEINQIANNELFYIGSKSKLISKFRKIDITNSLQFELNQEQFKSVFLVNSNNTINYENNTKLNQLKLSFDNAIRYNFSKTIDITGNICLLNTRFNTSISKDNIFITNPKISLNVKRTGFGNFSFIYSKNNSLPEINQLTTNFQLIDYRSFSKGTFYQSQIKNNSASFIYSFYNDKKRFSINTNLFYFNSKSVINTENRIANDLNFNIFIQTVGGESYNFNFNFVNYFRKLKILSKIETTQMLYSFPINVNSIDFSKSKSYNNSIKYTATTYFEFPVNLDFGFSYNYNQSTYKNSVTNNNTKDAFVNINYDISKALLVEFNNSFYYVNKQYYSFNTIIINYNPAQSHFSYRMIFNNIANEKQYTLITLSNYLYYKSNINLVPRYLLCSVKYRF